MTSSEIRGATLAYYSEWLGRSDILHQPSGGVSIIIYSEERNRIQTGYDRPIDLLLWRDERRTIISYGGRCAGMIAGLADLTADDTIARLSEIPGARLSRGIKFVYGGAGADSVSGQNGTASARLLTPEDYPLYENFFRSVNPGCSGLDWLRDYFSDISACGLCCGVIADGRLASCTDAPDMPYLADKVQELGVNTLEGYRRRGYACEAARLCVSSILRSSRAPLWSCALDNTASLKTAKKLGFEPLGEYLSLTL